MPTRITTEAAHAIAKDAYAEALADIDRVRDALVGRLRDDPRTTNEEAFAPCAEEPETRELLTKLGRAVAWYWLCTEDEHPALNWLAYTMDDGQVRWFLPEYAPISEPACVRHALGAVPRRCRCPGEG